MSAQALTAHTFEPAAEQTAATDHPAPEDIAAEIQFREDLWREYRREAINAGFSAAQATEYATALSSAMGLVAVVSEMAPVRRGWFYHTTSQWHSVRISGSPSPCPLPILWGEGGRRPGEGNVPIVSVNWYQNRPGVARRTITSGLIRLARREKSKTIGRTAVAGASRLARDFRWWSAEGKG